MTALSGARLLFLRMSPTMASVSCGIRFGSFERTSWPWIRKNGGLSTSKWMSDTFFWKAISRIWEKIFGFISPLLSVQGLCGRVRVSSTSPAWRAKMSSSSVGTGVAQAAPKSP